MNRFALYALAALLFLGGLLITVDKRQINAMRGLVGLSPLYTSEAAGMGAGALKQEMERLAGMTLPGVADGPTLGETADAGVECAVEETGAKPHGAAAEGLRRYLLNLAALGLDPEAPLVEPALRPLYTVLAAGPMAVLEDARAGRLSPEAVALLADYHRTYQNPDHPLYRGLELHGGTLSGLDFGKLAGGLAAQWRGVAGCTEDRALPPMAEWHRLEPG